MARGSTYAGWKIELFLNGNHLLLIFEAEIWCPDTVLYGGSIAGIISELLSDVLGEQWPFSVVCSHVLSFREHTLFVEKGKKLGMRISLVDHSRVSTGHFLGQRPFLAFFFTDFGHF